MKVFNFVRFSNILAGMFNNVKSVKNVKCDSSDPETRWPTTLCWSIPVPPGWLGATRDQSSARLAVLCPVFLYVWRI